MYIAWEAVSVFFSACALYGLYKSFQLAQRKSLEPVPYLQLKPMVFKIEKATSGEHLLYLNIHARNTSTIMASIEDIKVNGKSLRGLPKRDGTQHNHINDYLDGRNLLPSYVIEANGGEGFFNARLNMGNRKPWRVKIEIVTPERTFKVPRD